MFFPSFYKKETIYYDSLYCHIEDCIYGSTYYYSWFGLKLIAVDTRKLYNCQRVIDARETYLQRKKESELSQLATLLYNGPMAKPYHYSN